MSDNQRYRRKVWPNNKPQPSATTTFGRRTIDPAPPGPDPGVESTPKILLKPKSSTSAPSTASTSAISIAHRGGPAERPSSTDRPSAASAPALPPTATTRPTSSETAAPKPAANPESREPPAPTDASTDTSSTSSGELSVQIIFGLLKKYHELDRAVLEMYLQPTNTSFTVIGAIGTQGSGKSTLLNMLDTNGGGPDLSKLTSAEYFVRYHKGHFQTKRSQPGEAPLTRGIRMTVLRNRTMLLDCEPVLCNPTAKDVELSDLDDMRLVVFMLSVCQKLLVVDTSPLNMALVRLLSMAELLRPSLDLSAPERLAEQLVGVEPASANGVCTSNAYPVLMFVHNMAEERHLRDEHRLAMDRTYEALFRDSQLRVFRAGTESGAEGERRLNVMRMPRVEFGAEAEGVASKTAPPIGWHPNDWTTLTAQFRKWVGMATPTPQFAPGSEFSEQNWSQLVHNVWSYRMSHDMMGLFQQEQQRKNGKNNKD